MFQDSKEGQTHYFGDGCIPAHEPIGFEADAPEKEAECCHSCSIGGACEKSCDDPTLKHRKEKCNCEHTRVGLHDRLACQEYCLAKDCRCHDQRAETWEERVHLAKIRCSAVIDLDQDPPVKYSSVRCKVPLAEINALDKLHREVVQSAVEAERRRISEDAAFIESHKAFHCRFDELVKIINQKK